MGSQRTTAMLEITHTVGMTSITLIPQTLLVTAPLIMNTAQIDVSIAAGGTVQITAPTISLNGAVFINGMVPVVVPA
jgi:RNA 3'-terminal phosphate cyclase